MNISHIKCFWEVVNTGNFSEAADRLFITQSTVSKNIAALEKELGFLLFERRGRGVQLTSQGKRLLEYFNDIILANERAEDMIESIKKSGNKPDRSIRMSLVPAVEKIGMISAINRFSEKNPDTKFILEVADERQTLLALEAGSADLVFCSDVELDPHLYQIHPYSTHGFKLVVEKHHELAKQESIHMQDLKNLRMIFLHPDSMLWNVCIDACERAGFYPNIELTTCRPQISLEYVRSSNCAYMAIDLEVEECPLDTYAVVDIEDSPQFSYVFAWKKDRVLTPIMREFLKEFMR